MAFDNLHDINRLLGGTCSFNCNDQACIGDIARIEYVPLGPGAINFDLTNIRTVVGNKHVTCEACHTLSFFFAEITDHPREMIVKQVIGKPPFGNIWSFRCKD